MKSRCIAYLVDGSVCGRSATIIDKVRGGMVCALCAPITTPPELRACSSQKATPEGKVTMEEDKKPVVKIYHGCKRWMALFPGDKLVTDTGILATATVRKVVLALHECWPDCTIRIVGDPS